MGKQKNKKIIISSKKSKSKSSSNSQFKKKIKVFNLLSKRQYFISKDIKVWI